MLALIPQPSHIRLTGGTCPTASLSSVFASGAAAASAGYVAGLLKTATGREIKISADNPKGMSLALVVKTDGAKGGEGYTLSVTSAGLVLTAATAVGIARGAQTVVQLLRTSANGEVPCCEIDDSPRFPWRGSLLDAGRHFWTVADTKRYIDLLALYKLNVLHWHLTEDQGWRVEIRKYPRLTEIGAWRKQETGERYGGFYTQAEIREVVAYAAERGISVVPEIEMPGHSVAALAAYPELACTGGPFEVRTKWGVSEDVYCAGSEKVFGFLEDVLDEVLELFPSKYIHIGGDECPKKRWEVCPKCQERMRREGLATEFELQKYFINRIERFLASRGRTLVGWDEILESKAAGVGHEVSIDFSEADSKLALAQSAVVQSWRGVAGGVAAARTGHDVIMSPTTHCYLDYGVEGHTTQVAYGYEPVAEGLNAAESKHVLGLEGNVWTERIADRSRWDYMVFPRLCALAEVGWSSATAKDWPQFRERLRAHDKVLALHDVQFWRDPEVW